MLVIKTVICELEVQSKVNQIMHVMASLTLEKLMKRSLESYTLQKNSNTAAAVLDKKQPSFNKTIAEWSEKPEELLTELSRKRLYYVTQIYKHNTAYKESGQLTVLPGPGTR